MIKNIVGDAGKIHEISFYIVTSSCIKVAYQYPAATPFFLESLAAKYRRGNQSGDGYLSGNVLIPKIILSLCTTAWTTDLTRITSKTEKWVRR